MISVFLNISEKRNVLKKYMKTNFSLVILMTTIELYWMNLTVWLQIGFFIEIINQHNLKDNMMEVVFEASIINSKIIYLSIGGAMWIKAEFYKFWDKVVFSGTDHNQKALR